MVGLATLVGLVILLALVLDRVGGPGGFLVYLLVTFLFVGFVVLLLRPTAMGLARWVHRFQLRRQGMPGTDSLQRDLSVATLETLPSQRAMLLLEVRGLLLDLLALRFGSRRRTPRALLSLPQVQGFLGLHPPVQDFLRATEILAGDPEASIPGWSDLGQVDFSNRLARFIDDVRGDLG